MDEKKEKTTNKRNIEVEIGGTKLEVEGYEVPIKDSNTEEKRVMHNKKVVITNKEEGVEKRTADLFFGGKSDKDFLDDGTYVSEAEVRKVIDEALAEAGPWARLTDEAGKEIGTQDILAKVVRSAGKIVVGEKNEKITNQDSKSWGVVGKDGQGYKREGAAFLGNNGLQLPSGDYVSEEEIQVAVADAKTVDTPQAVTKTTKNVKAKVIVPIAACLVAAGISIIHSPVERPVENPNPITQEVETPADFDIITVTNLKYDMTGEIGEDDILAKISDLELGDEIDIPAGTVVNGNSELTGENITLDEGSEAITGVSIVYEGKMKAWIENFQNDESLQGTNVQEFLEQVCAENGIPIEDATMMLHLGVRDGWIDVTDLISIIDLEPESWSGYIEGFEGDSITVTTQDGGEVEIPVMGEDGNLLADGATVIGSDGKSYTINSLELEEITREIEVEPETEKADSVSQENETQTSGWDFYATDLTYAILMTGAAVALAIKALQKKRNDFNRDNPMYDEFGSQEELEEFLENAFSTDEEKSKQTIREFIVEKLFYEEKGVVEQLSDENLEQIVDIARNQMEIEKMGVKDGRIVSKTVDEETGQEVDENLPRETEIEIAREVHGEKIAEGTLSQKMKEKFKAFHQKMRGISSSKVDKVSQRIKEDYKDKDTPEKETEQDQSTDERDD